MESSGESGKINVSGDTYQLIKDKFNCTYRGKVQAKNKGEIDMYFVNGIVDDLKDENNDPNFKFTLKLQLIKLHDIEEYVFKMFDEEAPPNLYFHNSAFVKSLGNQVDLLSNAEGLAEEDYINLRLASIFLTTGYISDYDKPMEGSCQILEEALPKFGFEKRNVDAASRIIINSFSEKQESLADNILHDSKYDYLGRLDFLKLTEKLLKEETEYGMVKESSLWIKSYMNLINEHNFITPTAKLLRGVPVEDQLSTLKSLTQDVK